jgi:hypothetical protein
VGNKEQVGGTCRSKMNIWSEIKNRGRQGKETFKNYRREIKWN